MSSAGSGIGSRYCRASTRRYESTLGCDTRRFFAHFDFTELGKDCQDILYDKDSWVYPASSKKCTPIRITDLSDRQKKIADWWKSSAPCPAIISPFVLNWLDQRASSDNWDQEAREALSFLVQFGTERDRGLAADALTSGVEKHIVGRRTRAAVWGESLSLEDCSTVELDIGKLLLHVVDFGDSIHLNTVLQKRLDCTGPVERNQCAILSFAAAAEWVLQRRPNRVPGNQRVGFLASSFRAGEIRKADEVTVRAKGGTSDLPVLLTGALHDVYTFSHGRDIRLLNCFLLPAFWESTPVSVAILEVSDGNDAVLGHWFGNETDIKNPVSLLHTKDTCVGLNLPHIAVLVNGVIGGIMCAKCIRIRR